MLILGNRFPLIREKLPEPADRMTHDSPQHVVKVFPGVDPASLARLDQAQIQGRSSAAPLTARKGQMGTSMILCFLLMAGYGKFS